jgi:hypothetical protein
MKAPQPPGLAAAMVALLAVTASGAAAQQRAGSGLRVPPPSHGGGKHGFHGGFPIFIVEREVPVIIEREVVREVPAEPQTPVAPPPRKPFVIGKSYASLPGGCMKLIEGGASYYLCSGDWYRQVGSGRDARYRAVAKP